MSDAKVCDRCGTIIITDFMNNFPKMKTFYMKLFKIRPVAFDFCPKCIEDFIKFKEPKGSKRK